MFEPNLPRDIKSRNKSFDFRERLETIHIASKTKNFLLKNSTFLSLPRPLLFFASPLVCLLRVYFPRYPPDGELARRLGRSGTWWEHSLPTNVARVQIPASAPCVSWVCCWFFTFLREVFFCSVHSGSVFLPPKSTFPNSNSTRNGRRRTTSRMCCLSSYLFIYCCCFHRAPVKWIAPSVVTMKCVFQITKIIVCDVFVKLDIQEHLAVSYIKYMAMS